MGGPVRVTDDDAIIQPDSRHPSADPPLQQVCVALSQTSQSARNRSLLAFVAVLFAFALLVAVTGGIRRCIGLQKAQTMAGPGEDAI